MGRTTNEADEQRTPLVSAARDSIERRLDAAAKDYAAIADRNDLDEIGGVIARCRASQRYHHILGAWLAMGGEYEDSARAIGTAMKAEATIVKATKASLAGRVEELERLAGQARTLGAGVRRLHARAKHRPPPGANPREAT